jgi:chemotaxis signal transduction protein
MKVPALKFRVGEKHFAIDMRNVKHFFEVEEILSFPYLPHFVKGIVKYNNYAYPLISLKKAWNLNEEDSNIAVAIIYKGKEYAILIDEVLKIEELEKKEGFMIEVFEEDGELISKLDLEFLEYIEVPTFKNKPAEKKKLLGEENSYLLFKCNNELLAIKSEMVRKIDEYENKDTYSLNGFVIPLISFSKIYKDCNKESIVIIKDNNNKNMGLIVGEIIDVVLIEKDDIVKADGMFDEYFIWKNQEVKVFNNEYLKLKIEKFGVFGVEKEEKHFLDKVEVLIFKVLGQRFAMLMEHIVEIMEYKETNMHFNADNPFVKGLISTREGAAYVLSLEKLFNKEFKPTSESKIIVFRKHLLRALIIDQIEDLIYVDESKIVFSDSPESYIGGVVMDKEMLALFNPDWPKGL